MNWIILHSCILWPFGALSHMLTWRYQYPLLTLSVLFATKPSGVKAGAGNVSQSTSSQESRDQSADQTLTRRSALTASHSWDPAMSPAQPCMYNYQTSAVDHNSILNRCYIQQHLNVGNSRIAKCQSLMIIKHDFGHVQSSQQHANGTDWLARHDLLLVY